MTKLIGYAAVFGELSQDRRRGTASTSRVCRRRFEPGVFRESIRSGDVEGWWNHDGSIILARASDGSLRLWEDRIGLGFVMEVPARHDSLVEQISSRAVTKMSTGWREDDYRYDLIDGEFVRTITELRLFEISPVFSPAFLGTRVMVDRGRSIAILKRHLELDFAEASL